MLLGSHLVRLGLPEIRMHSASYQTGWKVEEVGSVTYGSLWWLYICLEFPQNKQTFLCIIRKVLGKGKRAKHWELRLRERNWALKRQQMIDTVCQMPPTIIHNSEFQEKKKKIVLSFFSLQMFWKASTKTNNKEIMVLYLFILMGKKT